MKGILSAAALFAVTSAARLSTSTQAGLSTSTEFAAATTASSGSEYPSSSSCYSQPWNMTVDGSTCEYYPCNATAHSFLLYDPNTEKCFSPFRHPSICNCQVLGETYDPSSESCYGSDNSTVPMSSNATMSTTSSPTGSSTTISCDPGYCFDSQTQSCNSC